MAIILAARGSAEGVVEEPCAPASAAGVLGRGRGIAGENEVGRSRIAIVSVVFVRVVGGALLPGCCEGA